MFVPELCRDQIVQGQVLDGLLLLVHVTLLQAHTAGSSSLAFLNVVHLQATPDDLLLPVHITLRQFGNARQAHIRVKGVISM